MNPRIQQLIMLLVTKLKLIVAFDLIQKAYFD